jgi:hypothetical protein
MVKKQLPEMDAGFREESTICGLDEIPGPNPTAYPSG